MKHWILHLFIASCLVCLLTSCGQAGKLYLPKQNKMQSTSDTNDDSTLTPSLY